MAATTTPSITWLADKLRADYPEFSFQLSDDWRWSPDENTIYYAEDADAPALLLHETAHAILGHHNFNRDLELLHIERDAWQHAQTTLSPTYQLSVPNELIDTSLDSYREWLHQRSLCPGCQATGVQQQTRHYSCLSCHTTWRVNDARSCALRRYQLKNPAG